jgi:hypothetical protein
MSISSFTAFGFNVADQRLPPWATSSLVMMRQEIDASVIVIQTFRFGCSRQASRARHIERLNFMNPFS